MIFLVTKKNICKHQIKILMFFCPDLTEGIIMHYFNSLGGTLNGGLSSMLIPCPILSPYS
jgi:hypothetical protein